MIDEYNLYEIHGTIAPRQGEPKFYGNSAGRTPEDAISLLKERESQSTGSKIVESLIAKKVEVSGFNITVQPLEQRV
ncbi:MAG: hypothetical protein A2256_03025 [Candidatus Staskawiczbacteria bacterium RIFOXYA2_FULL_32_7]|nr:MAG: hypothetical protein A2256_03025 [Candidatus Staskawiczbacteria bacterium RIFOXYA2_FULL_32_7]